MSDDLLKRLDAGAWPQAANMQEAAKTIRQQQQTIERLRLTVQDLLNRTKHFADMVYNDNGDMTVSGGVTLDQIIGVYWADKRARAAIRGEGDE